MSERDALIAVGDNGTVLVLKIFNENKKEFLYVGRDYPDSDMQTGLYYADLKIESCSCFDVRYCTCEFDGCSEASWVNDVPVFVLPGAE